MVLRFPLLLARCLHKARPTQDFGSVSKQISSSAKSVIICHFSGVYLPSVERLQCYGERAVWYAVIEQPAYNADASVGIALCETERIRSMVIVERNLAWMVGIVFPALQSVQTVLE